MATGEGRGRPPGGPSPLLGGGPDEPVVTGKSTVGRPRLLTDRHIAVILAERARFLIWRALRRTVKSQRQLAREFGVSQATISRAVRSKGNYKQPSPESRAATIAARNAVRRRIR